VADLGRASRVSRRRRARPELANLFTSFDPNYPQVKVELDRDKARKLGIPVNEAFTAMSGRAGQLLRQRLQPLRPLVPRLRAGRGRDRRDPEDIGEIHVRSNTTGDMVPLSTVTTVTAEPGTEITNRFNLFRSVEISGVPGRGFASGQALASARGGVPDKMPPEMGFAYSSMSYQEKVAPPPGRRSAWRSLSCSCCWRRCTRAGACRGRCCSARRSSRSGAFFGVWLTGYDNNVYVQIGLIMLIGLAAKNAILIVEFAKAKHDEGMPLPESALESARLRFRPILMTAFAFILGVVPLMLAVGRRRRRAERDGHRGVLGHARRDVPRRVPDPGNYVFVEQLGRRKAGPTRRPYRRRSRPPRRRQPGSALTCEPR
jgi:HAE1 family hydrophobic/amphiphilic exporter-1